MLRKLSHIKNHAITCRDFLLDMLFPIACLSCEKENSYLCPDCFKKIKINQNLSCVECNRNTEISAFCQSCQTKNELTGLWISADYHDETVAKLIKTFKYSFNKNIGPILGDLLCLFIQNNGINKKLCDFEKFIVFPVPLHKKRYKFRGFNQSELLAIDFAERFNLKLNAEQLVRKKNTNAQAKLGKKERLLNMEDAFAWSGNDLSDAKIILIDDVSSTRATLNNCAKILKQHGAKEVWGLVLAKN